MQTPVVYYTDFRTTVGHSILEKLQTLIRTAGIAEMDMKDQFVAIKIHFGEPGNLAFLRPNYAKAVADVIKAEGGRPFLTDCNTLYTGRRKHALEHLEAAQENGFSPLSTGCQMIIADGLKGTDEVEVVIPGGQVLKTAKLGRAIVDADVIVTLNHFKGHESTGFGGALKNLGMGCASRAGKMQQHNEGKPQVDAAACRNCHVCAKACAQNAFDFSGGKAVIDHAKCVGCGRCLAYCNFDAIYNDNASSNDELNRRIAEYSAAVVHGRPNFHINLVMDVSPYCDCHGENDAPILPDVGLFASFDPVALDQACADACNKMPPMPKSQLGDNLAASGGCGCGDHFTDSFPETDWTVCLAHAEKIGLGRRDYQLKPVKM